MSRSIPLDAMDSRTVLLGYAAVAVPLGLFISLWGTIWVGGSLNGLPFGLHSLVRMIGTVVIGAGLSAWHPDVVIQDLLMPGGLDGIETTARVVAEDERVKVIALTASLDEPRMMGVLRAGTVGYLRKDAEPETLIAAVRAVARGGTFIDPAVARLARDARYTEALTSRELDVLRQLAVGSPNKDIARALAIGEETVKTHVGHVLAKLEVENRAQAIAEALRRRLISVEDLERSP